MSGALNSIFGGGNIFGALLSIASIAFPPLAIASSLTNLLTQTLGQALKAGIDMLMQQFGLPKFVGEMIKGVIDQAVNANQKASSHRSCPKERCATVILWPTILWQDAWPRLLRRGRGLWRFFLPSLWFW